MLHIALLEAPKTVAMTAQLTSPLLPLPATTTLPLTSPVNPLCSCCSCCSSCWVGCCGCLCCSKHACCCKHAPLYYMVTLMEAFFTLILDFLLLIPVAFAAMSCEEICYFPREGSNEPAQFCRCRGAVLRTTIPLFFLSPSFSCAWWRCFLCT